MSVGRFFALEGPDGVGKTTLAERLADLSYGDAVEHLSGSPSLANTPLVFVSRRQVSGTSQYSSVLMTHLAEMLWYSGDSRDLPDSFWMTLQASWFTAHATTVVEPLLAAGYDVVVDGWVYKFFSKLQLQGHAQAKLDTVFGAVRMPDEIVLLTADAETLFDRRQARFRPSELGLHAGYEGLGRDTFVSYQTLGQQRLSDLAALHNWPQLHVWPEETVEVTTSRLKALLMKIRSPEANTTAGGTRP